MCGFQSVDLAAMTPRSPPSAERLHLVPHVFERVRDVELHLPLGVLDVDARDIVGRHQVVVHEREHAQLSHSATRCRPLCR